MLEDGFTSGFHEAGAANGESGLPKYERLREYVVSQIESGQYKPGAALPSEHRIAEILQIARTTVRQAMASLEKDGLVRRVHGKGTFVHEQARQRLRRGQDLFALIVPETQVGFYPALQRSFEAASAALHSQVIICNSNNEIDKQGNSILQLIDHRVAGVAIVPTTNPTTPAFQVRQLQQRGIPVVCLSRRVEGVQAPLLAIPFSEVGRRAGQAIRDAGHRRVAFISSNRTESSEAYERGFQAAFQGLGSSAEISIFFGSSSTPDLAAHEHGIAAALDEMFDGSEPPTAIYATFDSLAELAYLHLVRRGLRVPEDVSIVGFGGTVRNGALVRRLTSVTLDEMSMGREAVELLDQMRRGSLPIESTETRELPLELSDGHTLRRLGESEGLATGGRVLTEV